MRYHDFLLQLHAAGSDRVGVSVIASPAGEGDGIFVDTDLPAHWSREAPTCKLRDLFAAAGRPHALTPETMGHRLYGALFPPAVRSLFERSCDIARTMNEGLRLRILLNPLDPHLRQLQGLPWETLFRQDTGEFVAQSRFTPVVRSLAVSQRTRSVALSGPLRVLAAHAAPDDAPALDLARELAEMCGGDELGGLGMEIVPCPARLDDLRASLDGQGPFDVVHFLGHGGLTPERSEGFLVFEGVRGRSNAVSGATFARTLSDFPSIRLVVLNACRTGEETRVNPFGGVAAALIQAGLPAVIAMHEVVADEAAIRFARALYGQLALGQPCEQAVTQARQAVVDWSPRGFEWSVPVLFLRASRPPDEPDEARSSKNGIALFDAGDYALARQRLEEALAHDPGDERARLFLNLSRAALCRSRATSPPLSAIVEIDAAVASLCHARNTEVARLASLALAILRFDVAEPLRMRFHGEPSARLIAQLQNRSRTSDERRVADALDASRDVRILLNLPYRT